MYPEMMIKPMRDEVTQLGIQEARTAAEVDAAVKQSGTTLIFVNSVCGCAAGTARPGLSMAVKNSSVLPDRMISSFAGNDVEAVAKARGYFTGFAPSSPSMGLLKDGEIVWMLERWQIEGRPAMALAEVIRDAFNEHCTNKVAA